MNRNEFLQRCAALVAGAACMELTLSGCASLHFTEFAMQGGQAVVSKALFDETGFVLLDVKSLPAPVFVRKRIETDSDEYVALLMRCTHRGCTVRPAGQTLDCPCHGSRYTNEGKVIEGPADRDLRRLTTTTDEQHVQVVLTDDYREG